MDQPELQKAVESFPIRSWLQKHTKVYGGGQVIYADCPICKGKKRLGVYRRSRLGFPLAVCGRCKDGGHHQGRWTGSTPIPQLVKLLEGITWRQTFQLIHTLSGVPEPVWERPKDQKPEPIPEDAIPLSKCQPTERARLMLEQRHCGHLVETSFLTIGGKYNERVILPCYYQGHYMGFEAKGTHPSHDPKSLYGENMETQLTVYTAQGNDDRRLDLAITESVLDAETFHTLPCNSIGCYGGLKQEQVNSILKLGPDRIYWFLDGDAWKKLWPAIRCLLPFAENYVPPMRDKQDPNSIGPDGCMNYLNEARKIEAELDLIGFGLELGRML